MFGGASLSADASAQRLSMRDRALALRDRIYASEAFRRFAVAFPPTRFVARRRARALFDLVAGFVYSQTLFACVQLRLFDTLADGPLSIDDLARRADLPVDAMQRLVKSAMALDLLQQRSGGRFGLGPLGASLRGSPGVSAMIEHHAMFYADLADPVDLLRHGARGEGLSAYWAYAQTSDSSAIDADAARRYSALMSASQRMVSDEIFAHRPFDGCRRLLDVGGGDGTFARAVANACPDLAVSLCDLPPVAAVARRKIAADANAARIEALDCDFKSQPLPIGADVISLVRVLHDHDDPVVANLLRACWKALPPGGRIVIAEPMSAARTAEPMGDSYFGFYLLAMGSGRPRRMEETAAMLTEAGFANISSPRPRMPLIAGLITATKPLDDKTN